MAARVVERPQAVQIGGDMWRIIWLDDAEWDTHRLDEGSGGLTYGRETTVYIRTAVNCMEQHYQSTLIHELMHACLSTGGVGNAADPVKDMGPRDAEEFYVGLISPALLFVLKANDHVTKYLLSDGTVQR